MLTIKDLKDMLNKYSDDTVVELYTEDNDDGVRCTRWVDPNYIEAKEHKDIKKLEIVMG